MFVKKRMENEALILCMAEDAKKAFQTASRGKSGLLNAAENLRVGFEGASAADRAVGKTVALLCVDSKIKAVYASTPSREAERLFHDCCVYC
jgi:hypothetical protein